MTNTNISESISPEEKAAIIADLESLKLKLPFLINLTPEERQKLRKMGAVRTSYVQDVYQASVSNKSALPQGFSLEEYGKDLQLYRDMEEIMSFMLPLFEGMESTIIALSSELMKQTDQCYGHLKVEAKKNGNQFLSETIKRIAAQLKQSRKSKPTKDNSTQ